MEVWGVSTYSGHFIQYKFIIPESTKHSSYTYQKLFRALYGYTQNVTKSNGKTYKYHRRGILSDIAYIRPGKNCVIIPPKSFAPLDTFFKTGKNPTHYWKTKGNWKAVFYMDEKNLEESQVITALKELIGRLFQKGYDDVSVPDLLMLAEKAGRGDQPTQDKVKAALSEAEKVVSSPWFKEIYQKDNGLRKFFESYRQLKS